MLNYIEKRLSDNNDLLITFIGDSITHGINHCTPDETYVAELAKLLAAHFPNADVVRYDGIVDGELNPIRRYNGPFVIQKANERRGSITVVRCGVGGNTVRRALNRADDYCLPLLHGKLPDIYFAMFGINDALSSDPAKFVSPDRFESDYRELISTLKNANSDAKLVLMTPTYNDLGDSAQSHLEPYCDKVRSLAAEYGAHIIDTHELWMDHLIVGTENYGQRGWLSGKKGDSCHFSPEGSRATARFIFDSLGD